MQIEDRVAVEADIVGGADQKLDRILMVEDHLRFEMRAPRGFLSEFDEALGVEKRVGVAFEATRIPGEVDQEPAQDLPGIGAGRLLGDPRPADGRQTSTLSLGQVEGDVRAIAVEEAAIITDGLAGLRRLADIIANRDPGL